MRHGRKAALKREALGLRKEMELELFDPLDCFYLCEFLGIEIRSFAHMIHTHGVSHPVLHNIYGQGRGYTVSALTVCRKDSDLILYNENHTETRIQNSVVHEIAHYYLGHTAMQSIQGEEGFARGESKDEDEEANHFSSCLLIPREGMLRLMKDGQDISGVAEHYRVSPRFAQMRYNLSGIKRQLKYAGR